MKRLILQFCVILCMALVSNQMMAQKTRTGTSKARTTVSKGKSRISRKSTKTAGNSIVGKHSLTLQWLSWTNVGKCTIGKCDANGQYPISGRQTGGDEPQNVNDYLTIDGYITYTDASHLVFHGRIVTKVYHINGGEPVVREGDFDFVRKGKKSIGVCSRCKIQLKTA